jgi:hypothetical protein
MNARRLVGVTVISIVTSVFTVLCLRPTPTPPAAAAVYEHFGATWHETELRHVEDSELLKPVATYQSTSDPLRYLVRQEWVGGMGPDDYWLVECIDEGGRLLAHGQCEIRAKDGTLLQRRYDRGEWID